MVRTKEGKWKTDEDREIKKKQEEKDGGAKTEKKGKKGREN